MKGLRIFRMLGVITVASLVGACGGDRTADTFPPTSTPATTNVSTSVITADTRVTPSPIDPAVERRTSSESGTAVQATATADLDATTSVAQPSAESTPEPVPTINTAATSVAEEAPDAPVVETEPISATIGAVIERTPVSTSAIVDTTVVAPTEAPSATPEQWTEYMQYTIEGLRARSYGTGEIEIVQTLEETPSFTRYLIAYPSDGLRITGMLNRPHGDGPFPVVILNHGYYPLDVYQTGNGTKLAADYLANHGYMTISPDFRSHAGSDDAPNLFRAGHVIDTLNVIPLAQKLPSAKPGKVGMWGHSNGGAITAKVIVVSDQIGAALIYAPASSNIGEDYQFRVERAQSRGGTIDRVEWPVLPEEAPDLYERLSPLPYLQYVTAPVQIHWGTNDETVPRKWPEDLLVGLQQTGKNVQWFEYPGEPHSFTAAGNNVYLPRMVEFFDQYLR